MEIKLNKITFREPITSKVKVEVREKDKVLLTDESQLKGEKVFTTGLAGAKMENIDHSLEFVVSLLADDAWSESFKGQIKFDSFTSGVLVCNLSAIHGKDAEAATLAFTLVVTEKKVLEPMPTFKSSSGVATNEKQIANLRQFVRGIKDKKDPKRAELIEQIVPMARQDIENAMIYYTTKKFEEEKEKNAKLI